MKNEGKKIKYSVLMSIYEKDNAVYVKTAIESMLNQTYPLDQYVIVKDGPVNIEIEKMLYRFCEKYPTIFTIVEIKENKGLANALNVGLLHCRNDLVARMDADDISLPVRCEKILDIFCKNPDVVICGCNIDEFYGECTNIKTSRIVPVEDADIKKFMRKRQPFNHPTVIYKKSKVIEAGGYIPLKRKEDFDLFSRMISSGYITRNVNESLYLYRADEENYLRRKSFLNFQSAIYVYWRHFFRNGCNLLDFIVMCGGEVLFLILPINVMKKVSDRFLRKEIQ